jgi:poly(3-hydroxyalkanoate) synthetase
MVPARTGTRESRSSEAVTSEREIFIGNPSLHTLDNFSRLRKITSPTFILGTKEENIAPSKSAYRATQFYGGPVKFVLSASGHMAGVISAPGSKYGHWTNSSNPATADEWFKTATECRSSWWPHWNEWVTTFSGGQVAARTPGEAYLSSKTRRDLKRQENRPHNCD